MILYTSVLPAPFAIAAGTTGRSFRHRIVCQINGYALATRSVSSTLFLKRCAARKASKAFIPPISLGTTASKVSKPAAFITAFIASLILFNVRR